MHHLVLVLVPPDTEDVAAKTEELMAPHKEFKWDWWRIGGRWDGAVYGERRWMGSSTLASSEEEPLAAIKMHLAESESGHMPLEYNVRRVSELAEAMSGFAVVTPDGEWHEPEDWGWLVRELSEKVRGESHPSEWTEEERKGLLDWNREVRTLLCRHQDCLAVACDVHN